MFALVPVFIVAIVFGSALAVLKLTLDYKQRQALNPGPQEGALRTSELESIIRRAVEDAVTPVQERLDALERRALPEAGRPDRDDSTTP